MDLWEQAVRSILHRRRSGWVRIVVPALVVLGVLAGLSTCCRTVDFTLPDFRGRLDFSGSLAFEFEFDANMEFEFDGDFSGWAKLDAVSATSLGIDLTGKVAFEQELDVDIDDDGVDERVSVIGLSDGDARDVDTVLASWEGDEYTFDEGYCYLLVVTEDSMTLITGRCNGDSPVLTCTSPTGDDESVSCVVCDAGGQCAPCDSKEVSECIDEGSEALGESRPPATPEPPPATDDASSPIADAGAMEPETAFDAGSTEDGSTPGESPDEDMVDEPEPDVTESPEYQTCVQQANALRASVSLCGLALGVEIDSLCRTSLAAVERCFESVDGASIFENPCDVLRSEDCAELVE